MWVCTMTNNNHAPFASMQLAAVSLGLAPTTHRHPLCQATPHRTSPSLSLCVAYYHMDLLNISSPYYQYLTVTVTSN
jgi:hypothetical protein